MPCVASLDAFHRAVGEFVVEDLGLAVQPAALAAARRSLDSCGLLLLGEVHGVRENPLVIRALMQAFGLTSLALEWPDDLAPMVRAFLAGEPLDDHPWLWGGDGRITAGHLAVLAERSKAGPLEVILFDGIMGAGWSWSQRDEAMARRLLAGSPSGARTLAVAGNAHTPTRRTDLGVPLGACLARQRPGIREIRIRYGSGRFWNFASCQFAARASAHGPVRLHEDTGELVLDLPMATEAVVPQRPQPSPPPMRHAVASPERDRPAATRMKGSAMIIGVFLHGTAIMHASAAAVEREERVRQVRLGEPSVRDFASYIPTPGTAGKLAAWQRHGASITYLSSHCRQDDIRADESVIRRHGFPAGPVYGRQQGEGYGPLVERLGLDVLVEDDCESIGGAAQTCAAQLSPGSRQSTRCIVLPEFSGLTDLPDEPAGLLEPREQ